MATYIKTICTADYKAENQKYRLEIVRDESEDRIEDDEWSTLGHLLCSHPRYQLGDDADYDPEAFWHELLLKQMRKAPHYGKPVFEFYNKGINRPRGMNYPCIKLEHENDGAPVWRLYDICINDSYVMDYWRPTEDAQLGDSNTPEWFVGSCIMALNLSEVISILESTGDYIIRPVWLYDHGSIKLEMSPTCRWDSSFVGFVYASKDDQYWPQDVWQTEEGKQTILNDLSNKIEVYNALLNGDVYGFELYDISDDTLVGTEVDSCYGFVGELDDIRDIIREYLPDEAKELVDELEAVL